LLSLLHSVNLSKTRLHDLLCRKQSEAEDKERRRKKWKIFMKGENDIMLIREMCAERGRKNIKKINDNHKRILMFVNDI
jgi:hypothetical protein